MDATEIAPPLSAPQQREPRLRTDVLGTSIRVIVAVGVLALANVVMVVVPVAASLIPGAADIFGGSSPGGFALAAVAQLCALVAVVGAVRVWMRAVERKPMRSIGWRWGRWSIAWMLGAVALTAASVLAVTALLPSSGPARAEEDLPGGAAPTTLMLVLLLLFYLGQAFVQQSIPEELLFRGLLLGALRERPIVAIAVSTLAFTVIHLVSNGGQQSPLQHVLYLAVPFGFSLLAVGMLLWTGSLWAAVGVHGGVHVGNYTAFVLLPEVDGPTFWLCLGAVHTAAGVAAIITALRAGKRLFAGDS